MRVRHARQAGGSQANFGPHSLIAEGRVEGITGVGLLRLVLGFDRYMPPDPVTVASLAERGRMWGGV